MNNNNAEDNQSAANLMESDGEDTPQQPEQQRDDAPATENSTPAPAPAPPTRQPVVVGLQSASRMNKKLYSLFITKRYQECKEAIEVIKIFRVTGPIFELNSTVTAEQCCSVWTVL